MFVKKSRGVVFIEMEKSAGGRKRKRKRVENGEWVAGA